MSPGAEGEWTGPGGGSKHANAASQSLFPRVAPLRYAGDEPALTRPPFPPDVRRSVLSAALLAGALALAAVLSVSPARATLAGAEGPGCVLGAVAGAHPCPGGGLARAPALAGEGRPAASFRVHPAGVLVAGLCLAGLVVHLHAVWRRRRTARHDALLRAGRWAFAVGILAGWLVR